ncbi:MAG: hypothetical protein ACYTF0_04395, partial [Planctomycetota bacterium]
DDSAKARHLRKDKPPSLNQARSQGGRQQRGATEPHLRRSRDEGEQPERSSMGPVKLLALLIMTLILCVVLVAILYLFVPAVRNALNPLLPENIQAALNSNAGSAAAAPTDG